MLRAAVEAEPDDPGAWSALVDFLIEFTDCEPGWAWLQAERHQRIGREARELAEATRLMAIGSPALAVLRGVILDAVGLDAEAEGSILLEAGPHHPLALSSTEPDDAGTLWTQNFITVGAGWVLDKHRENARGWANLAMPIVPL